MMRSFTSGVAGLKAFQTAMDVIGNNIANLNTYGFRSSRTLFSDTLYQTMQAASASGAEQDTDTGKGGTNASQIGYGSSASQVQMSTDSGGYTSTSVGMDAYIDGEGYFVVSTSINDDKTPGGLEYTRVGDMGFDDDGYLTINGNRVVGKNNDAKDGKLTKDTKLTTDDITDGTKLEYIQYKPVESDGKVVNTLSSVSIAKDGTITAKNGDGDVVTVGQVAIAHFDNPGGLTQEGNSLYSTSANSGKPLYYTAGSGATGSLISGALEASNVDIADQFSNMIQTERGYQAVSKVISASSDMLETLVNIIR